MSGQLAPLLCLHLHTTGSGGLPSPLLLDPIQAVAVASLLCLLLRLMLWPFSHLHTPFFKLGHMGLSDLLLEAL